MPCPDWSIICDEATSGARDGSSVLKSADCVQLIILSDAATSPAGVTIHPSVAVASVINASVFVFMFVTPHGLASY